MVTISNNGSLTTICILLELTYADRDDKKWVWDNNSRSSGRSAAIRNPDYRKDISVRYEVHENESPYDNYPPNDFSDRPFIGNQGPFESGAPYRPGPRPIPNEGFRPGGVYGQNNFGSEYGEGHGNYNPDDRPISDILTGPIPSWVKEGPYKEFDRCKCAEKFNCNSPGISYGHCDVGKQYCCYSTSKKGQLGGPLPSRPIHSNENGILIGPGGPFDEPNNSQRPPFGRPGGSGLGTRPVGPFRPGSGNFGFGGRPRPGFIGDSPENDILVGPGGPFDRPNQDYGSGFSPRSATVGSKRQS